MSKKWTPELDAILLHGVFEECGIAIGKALCEKLAERVRAAGVEGFTECTPKSIENRLYTWKKKYSAVPTASGDTPVSTPKKAAPKAKKEPATPKAKTPRAKKGAIKKKAGDEEDDEELAPAVARKRSAETEEVGEEKRLKLECGGDEGVDASEAEDEV